MKKHKPLVCVTRKLPAPVEARMAELFEVRFSDRETAMTREELEEMVKDAEVLVPTLMDRIDADLISKAGPNLKMIANFGNGTDHINIAAAHKRGIIVTSTPGVTTEDAADMVVAMIIAIPRRLTEGTALMQSGVQWPGWSPTWMLGRRLRGMKLGIIGMGRIGQAVAARALPFGISVHYHARRPIARSTEEALSATYWANLDEMLAHVDIVSVNCPFTPETYHLLSKRTLGLVRPDAYVVNTSRGEIIDQEALISCLEQGTIAGAALDVLEQGANVDPRLTSLAKKGKLVLIPHLASATLEGRIDMGEKVIINIQVYADGHRPPDRVLPPSFAVA
ncbi:MAG: D-glycerate dehydrogenase [Pseudomonadota bacterium]